MSINVKTRSDSMGQQGVAIITFYKCDKKVITEMAVLIQLAQTQYHSKPQHIVPILL